MTHPMLINRDYTLILDRSGSMASKDIPGKSRWTVMKETTIALANKCEEFDPDGLTIYTFSSKFKKHENALADKVAQIFQEEEPNGSTNLALVLKAATDNFIVRKKANQLKENGEIIIVVTDGEPDDKKAVVDVIINTSKVLDTDSELGILFLQIGNDSSAKAYLKLLDDSLQSAGAKFDIVDTITMDEVGELTLTEVLLNAIND